MSVLQDFRVRSVARASLFLAVPKGIGALKILRHRDAFDAFVDAMIDHPDVQVKAASVGEGEQPVLDFLKWLINFAVEHPELIALILSWFGL